MRRQSLLASTALTAASLVSLGVTRLVFASVVGRTGGAEVLGRVSTMVSISLIVSLGTAAATGAAASKFMAQALATGLDGATTHVAMILRRWTTAVTALAVIFAVGLAVAFIPHVSLGELAALAALVGSYGWYSFLKGEMYGRGLVRSYALLELVYDIAIVVAVLVASPMTSSAAVLLLPLAIGYGLFSVHSRLVVRRAQGVGGQGIFPTALGTVRTMAVFVALSALGMLASQGFLQASMVASHAADTASRVGVFAAALALTTPAFFLPRALSMSLFPLMSAATSGGELNRVGRQVDSATRALTALAVPLIGAAMVLSAFSLRLVYGREFEDGYRVLILLLCGAAASVVSVPSTNSLSSRETRYARIPPLVAVGGLLVGLLIWAVVGSRFGVEGVAFGYAVGAGLQLLIAGAAWRLYALSWTGLAGRSAVTMTLGAALGWQGLIGWPAAAAAAGYAAVGAALHAPELRLLTRVVRPART